MSGKIKMHSVTSSHIKEVGHDGKDSMRVVYKTGRAYNFHGISPEHFDKIRKAESVGRAIQATGITGKLHQEPKAATHGKRG